MVFSLTSVQNRKTSNGFTFMALLTDGGATHIKLTIYIAWTFRS